MPKLLKPPSPPAPPLASPPVPPVAPLAANPPFALPPAPPMPPSPLTALIRSEVDGDTNERSCARVGEAAAVAVACPTAGPAAATKGRAAESANCIEPATTIATGSVPAIVPHATVATPGHVRCKRAGRGFLRVVQGFERHRAAGIVVKPAAERLAAKPAVAATGGQSLTTGATIALSISTAVSALEAHRGAAGATEAALVSVRTIGRENQPVVLVGAAPLPL